MTEAIQPLVLTPRHYPTESLLGYTLWVSEKNGYDTPWHVMTHAGLTQGKMDTAGFSYEKLAAILGKDSSELEPISYRKVSANGKIEFKILGHSLGRSLKFSPLRLGKPQFCKYCAQEQGILDAFWDLRLVVACPVHRCTLIHACPSCGAEISWFRPGILKCKCGANFVSAVTENIADELTSMMAVIKAKLHDEPINSIENSCGLPISDLGCLPLRSLLVLIEALGQQNMAANECELDTPSIIVQNAIHVLRNWPNNFHEFLRRIDNGNVQAQGCAIGLRKRFGKIFLSLFKRRSPLEGIGFLRQEFVRFGLQEWGEGVVDNKLLGGDHTYKRFVSLSTQAKRMGIQRVTLKRWSESGVIQKQTIHIGRQKRYVIDSDSVKLKKADGKVFSERKAAAFVGLPVSVVVALRNSGHYEVCHVTKRLESFHEVDLRSFIKSLCSLGEIVKVPCPSSISLGDVMRLQFNGDESKADFIREILSKNIEVLGRTGDSPADLLFHRSKVETFLRDKRASSKNSTWSLSEAAKYLHCDPVVLPTIIGEGLLESVEVSTGLRVTEKSVKDFDGKFVAVAKLANKVGTSSRRLQEELFKKNIPMRTFKRGLGKVDQPFVNREHDDLLTEIIERLIENSKDSQHHPSSATLLRQYLDRIKENGILLPRRAGKPNKVEVSKSCGFDRNNLYSNAELMRLLNDFDAEEKQRNGGEAQHVQNCDESANLSQHQNDEYTTPSDGSVQ